MRTNGWLEWETNSKGGDKKMVEKKRKITKKDRKIYRGNALKGTEKWKRTPTGARKAERVRKNHGWGFDGKKPQYKEEDIQKKEIINGDKWKNDNLLKPEMAAKNF